MNIKRIILILACIFALTLCGTVSAVDTTNVTSNTSNSSIHSLQSSTSVNSTHSQITDPIISGVVRDNSTNKGLANVSIKVLRNNTLIAQTQTRSDGTYSLNFINSNTSYTIIASKLGYMPFSKTITVTPSSNPDDKNLYGTANFRLYTLLKYSGNASSYVLNVGVLPQVLLDIYAGKSSAWVNSTSSTYATGGGTSLEVKLLTSSLLAGLLDVYSTGNEGAKVGGLFPAGNSTLNAILNRLGLNVGLLSANSNSSANPPQSSGSSEIASVDLNIKLLQILSVLSLDVGAVSSNSSVTPDFNTGILVSSSNAGVANVIVSLLGVKLLEIDALQTNATASVNGKPGGAKSSFIWQVADIEALGVNILNDLTLNGHVSIGLLGINILNLSLGSTEEIKSADGTYAKASGDALRLQILGILGGGLVNLVIGHTEAQAQVPVGGLHVNTSDLGITKVVDNANPNYLQNVTFTLTAHNNGPDNAAGVKVTDKLPSGLKFISASGNGTYNSTTGVWTIGTLTNGANAVINIIAQIIASNTQITNVADISGDNYDPEPSNDQSNVTITVNPASDLGITKTVNNSHPNYLQNVTFTLTAHNYGPDNATGVTVTDKLPSGLKFISSNGNYNSTTGIWTIGNLANGANAILQIIAQVIASNTQITNIATINGSNYDPEPGNDQSNITITVNPASDLGITKTVNNTHPNYLQNVTFTLTAHNYGPNTATGVAVTDKLPNGLKFISASGNGTYNSATGVWTIGNLANGANAILQIIAQVIASNTQITNIAVINGTNYDQNSTNNQSNSTITVNPASDIGISKTVDNSHPNYLQNVTFTLTAHNYGPNTATGATVTDKLPTGLKFISSNGNYNSTTGVWTIGNLANGANAVLKIIAQVIASNTQITNIAVINGTNYDQNSTNNQSNSTITVNPASDIGITKTVDNKNPNYLDNVTFTLTVHNYGPDSATGVTVTDKLPSGLKFVSSNGNYNSTTGVWTIGNLANGANAILNIIAQIITSNTQITNIATINGTNYDQNATNNQSNSTVTVGPASDLKITKTVNNTNPSYLQNVTFTLTAHNYGPDDAICVTVTDKLPTGLKFISANGNGTYNSTSGIWTIGTLTNGVDAVLNIIAQVIASNTQITNIATINGTNYDQNSTNNQSNSTITVNPASDIGITKTVNNSHPNYLQNVTFTLTAHNYGPDNATGVTVTDKLPTGLKFISSNGNYNSTTGIWTIGNLANGANAVLQIIAQVIKSNTQITNIAVINGGNYDQNSTNDQSNVTVTVNPASDIGITKTVNNIHPNYLDNVTFTLTAHNYGPDTAAGVKVTDKLPTGLKFISSNGNYNSTTGVWTIGNLANGSDAILQIIAQVIASNTQITNIASVNGTNYDQNSTNNQSNSTITVNPSSDLGITKTVDNANPKYMQNVTFTLTAHNYGPNNATGVTVTDKLPTGLKFISSNGNYNSTTGVWTIGNLANGANAVLKIIAQAIAANAQITNIATINGTNYDQNLTNDQSNATVNVGPASDLGITITVNNAHPKYLDYVTFTLTANNYGPDNADYVKVYNTLPDKLKYVSDDSNGAFNPTYNATTGLWTIGYMANGATAVLHIVAQAMASNVTLTDVARITDPDPTGFTDFYDPNQANDQASVTVNVGPATDLSIAKTVNNSHPNYLQNVTFTLTAHNNGPNNATGVTVVDKLPTGLKFVSASGNGTYNSTSGIWTIGNLANGANAVLNIIAQVTVSSTKLINTASITGSETDLNLTNNKANVTATIGAASDLGITKTVDNSRPKYLQNVTFTLTAHNYGPNTATGVAVTDKLPNGLKFISASGNGTYNSTTGVWTIGNLANGANAVLKIIAQAVTPNARVTNIATINGTNYDQKSSNNNASATVTIGPAADLAVTMAVNNARPKYLQKVTFTITAYNYGPMNAKNVTLTIKMPKGLKFVSSDSNVKYNSKTGVWTIGNLNSGSKVVLHIVEQAVVSNVKLTSTASIQGTAIMK